MFILILVIIKLIYRPDTVLNRSPIESTRYCALKTDVHADGLTLIRWERGWVLLWNTTCVDTFAPSHVRKIALNAGAAEKAKMTKRRRYLSQIMSLCRLLSKHLDLGVTV
ncbi:unnamed protein product [Euphydryas editha]|uniref:Uncharacterized protein n=1 Tax=Euphydryas editha TaxID=104508 RepID=A0AAU9UGN8_EUPED|nr:unnamed protein product [Euphydryas editha]